MHTVKFSHQCSYRNREEEECRKDGGGVIVHCSIFIVGRFCNWLYCLQTLLNELAIVSMVIMSDYGVNNVMTLSGVVWVS